MEQTFSSFKSSQYRKVVPFIIFLFILEPPLLHLLLSIWLKGVLGLVVHSSLFFLEVLGLLWFYFDCRAMNSSCHTITALDVSIHLGFRAKMKFRKENVKLAVLESHDLPILDSKTMGVNMISLGDTTNVTIKLQVPVSLKSYFKTMMSKEIRLFVDRPAEFLESLKRIN